MSQASVICSYDKYQYKAIPSTDYHNGDLEKSSSSSFNLNISKNDNNDNNNNNNQLTSKPNGFTIIILFFFALLLVGLSFFWFYTSFSIVKNDIAYTGEFKIKSMLYLHKILFKNIR